MNRIKTGVRTYWFNSFIQWLELHDIQTIPIKFTSYKEDYGDFIEIDISNCSDKDQNTVSYMILKYNGLSGGFYDYEREVLSANINNRKYAI